MRPQAVVIGASHRGERSQGVILWRSQITASHVLTADTRITLAVPLPPSVHYDAHLSSPLHAERDEAGSIVAFVATDVIVQNVTIALSQPVAGAWVVLAAPIVRGNVVQRVVVVEGHDVLQFSPDRALTSVEHVGWMSLGGLEHRDKSVCDALHDGPGVLPQIGGLYLRAESLDS